VSFLRRCAEIGVVTIALNTDEFIEQYKGKRPVMSYEEREALLLGIRYVDRVIPNFAGTDSKPAIELVRPDVIVIGSDWARRDYYKQMGFTQDWLDDRNISLMYVPYTKGISTTDLKRRMQVN
jgi:glycerol-3-phosphate cytidylyltransferase-like family protein